MERHAAPLTEGPIARTLIRLAIPIVLANMLQTAYQMTDTFWVGRLSAGAVAAVSLSFPINFLSIALGGGLPIAGTVLIAQFRGRGDERAMNHVAAQTMLMVMVVSIVLSVMGYLLAEPIMHVMGAEPDVFHDAVTFLRVTFLGFIFVFGFFVFQSFMRGVGSVKLPLYVVFLTVVLNFVLDPLLIFGVGPIPPLGVAGAAWATLATQAIATTIGFIVLFRGHDGLKLNLPDFRPDFRIISTAFRLGFPTSIEQSTRAMGMTMMMLLVSGFGTLPVAGYGVGVRMLLFITVPALGLSIATSALVGQNIGAGKLDRAIATTRVACFIAFTGLSVVGLVMFFIATPLARFFAPQSGEAIEMSAQFIRIIAFSFGFIGLQQVITGTLRGAGDTLAAMILAIIALWVLQFPMAYLLSRDRMLGVQGVWWAIALANVIAAGVSITWYMQGRWTNKRVIDSIERDLEKRISDAAKIDEGFTP